jgi:hypothetical protein
MCGVSIHLDIDLHITRTAGRSIAGMNEVRKKVTLKSLAVM